MIEEFVCRNLSSTHQLTCTGTNACRGIEQTAAFNASRRTPYLRGVDGDEAR
jgi:hypothetical protein